MADDALNYDSADPEWFRPPSAREHRIAAALFVGFGIFFALLFFVLAGWWFRWVILSLGAISIIHGVRHAIHSRANVILNEAERSEGSPRSSDSG